MSRVKLDEEETADNIPLANFSRQPVYQAHPSQTQTPSAAPAMSDEEYARMLAAEFEEEDRQAQLRATQQRTAEPSRHVAPLPPRQQTEGYQAALPPARPNQFTLQAGQSVRRKRDFFLLQFL